MTREIKFRAIDEMNVWWYFTLEDLIRGDSPATTGVLKNWCQSTGLHDKNRKEIYEGDIVKGVVKFPQLFTGDTDENSNFNMAGSVFYDYSGFSLKCIQSMCDPERDGMANYFDFIGDGLGVFDDKEIIGNIYENPELLTNNK